MGNHTQWRAALPSHRHSDRASVRRREPPDLRAGVGSTAGSSALLVGHRSPAQPPAGLRHRWGSAIPAGWKRLRGTRVNSARKGSRVRINSGRGGSQWCCPNQGSESCGGPKIGHPCHPKAGRGVDDPEHSSRDLRPRAFASGGAGRRGAATVGERLVVVPEPRTTLGRAGHVRTALEPAGPLQRGSLGVPRAASIQAGEATGGGVWEHRDHTLGTPGAHRGNSGAAFT
jgi:hypothetical protein